MPLYEYICSDCHAGFEKLVRAWGEVVVCPSCASGAVEKQLSTFAFAGTEAGLAPGASGGCGCGRGGCGCAH